MTTRCALPLVAAVGLISVACFEDNSGPLPTIEVAAEPSTAAEGEMLLVGWVIDNFNIADEEGEHDEKSTRDDDDDDDDDDDEIEYDGPREGHVHVYIGSTETEPVAMTSFMQLPLCFSDPGTFTVIGRLHALDHRAIVPEVSDSVVVTITAGDGVCP